MATIGKVVYTDTYDRVQASDGAGSDHFGEAVALDGDVLVVGAPFDDDGATQSGVVFVFERLDGVWTQTAKLVPDYANDYSYFGYSVAVSGDTIVVGRPESPYWASNAGQVYVYVKSAGVWSLQQELAHPKIVNFHEFGNSVCIQGDTIVTSVLKQASDGKGYAYVFTRTAGVWGAGSELATAHSDNYDYLGLSMAFRGDVIVAGLPLDNTDGFTDNGTAVVWENDGGWAETAWLKPSDPQTSARFGNAVATDGSIIAVGANQQNGSVANEVGAIYVFEKSLGTWSQTAKLVSRRPERAEDRLPSDRSLCILADGAIVAGAASVDRYYTSSVGAVSVFRPNPTWSEGYTEEEFASPAEYMRANGYFGASVATDGVRIAVGAYGENGLAAAAGAAYVITPSGSPTDEAPPVITVVSPPVGTAIATTEALVFDITEDVEMLKTILLAKYIASDPARQPEVVFDGDDFCTPFTSSTRVPITNGYRYTITRTGGWLASPTIQAFAADASGNEAT